VRLTAEHVTVERKPDEAIEIAEDLWLQIGADVSLTKHETFCLVVGLTNVAADVREHARTSENVLIRLSHLDFDPTDFQPEGLTCAIMGWAAKAFDFPSPTIEGFFDDAKGRYVFSFGPREDSRQSTQDIDPVVARRDAANYLKTARDLLSLHEVSGATRHAGFGACLALGVVAARGSQRPLKQPSVSDFEVLRSRLFSNRKGQISANVERGFVRFATWYPDARFEPFNFSERDASEFLISAETILRIVGEEVDNVRSE